MKISEFQKLAECEEEKEMDKLELGDFFLYGRSVIMQKQNKQAGDSISFYQVIEKEGSSVSYAPVFDYMEED